jgi:ABC-type ATPase with predicted acetyltransferase domain
MPAKNRQYKKHCTCRGCRWYSTYNSITGFCLYHFPTEKTDVPVLWRNYTAYTDIYVDIKPTGKCPKPITISESVYWSKHLKS